MPKQNAGEVVIQSFVVLMIFCTFVKLMFFYSLHFICKQNVTGNSQQQINMTLENINPTSFNWDNIVSEKLDGETGYTIIRTQIVGTIKIRKVEYSTKYLADHWCDKGHIVIVISGQLFIEHKDTTKHLLISGSTYVVGDNSMAHKAMSTDGAIVIIVD